MKKDVIISINGLEQADDPEAQAITLETCGRLYSQNGHYYVSYEESELTGMSGTRTTIKLDNGTLTVMRTGLYPSHLVFEKGQKHTSFYGTDYGVLSVAVNTRSIDGTIGEDGGNLDVLYDIEIDHAYIATNRLTVNVRNANIVQ